MAETPRDDVIYEDDFFVVTDDPDDRMVNVAFIERGLVLRFDYEEFLELAPVVAQTRDYIQRAVDRASENGR